MKKTVRTVAAALALLMLLPMLFGCSILEQLGIGGSITVEPGSEEEVTTGKPVVTVGGDESSEVTEDMDETSSEVTDEVTNAPDDQTKLYINPLTGLKESTDLTFARPVSIIIDNVSAATPQSGITNAEIVIECEVEGGVTRLMLVTNQLKGLSEYGPVRSTRDYFVSLSAGFNAFQIIAGGSPKAYEMLITRKYDYVCGVNTQGSGVAFYRDPLRVEQNGYSHSMMITGSGIKKLADNFGISLTTRNEVSPYFNFVPEDGAIYLNGGEAKHVCINYSSVQYVQLLYSRTDKKYYRYEFGDKPQMDAETGDQLSFSNVFVLFTDVSRIEGDEEGRLDLKTVGSGEGYYISGGRYQAIRWSRASDSAQFSFTTSSGVPIQVNRGTSLISFVRNTKKNSVTLNYKVTG